MYVYLSIYIYLHFHNVYKCMYLLVCSFMCSAVNTVYVRLFVCVRVCARDYIHLRVLQLHGDCIKYKAILLCHRMNMFLIRQFRAWELCVKSHLLHRISCINQKLVQQKTSVLSGYPQWFCNYAQYIKHIHVVHFFI